MSDRTAGSRDPAVFLCPPPQPDSCAGSGRDAACTGLACVGKIDDPIDPSTQVCTKLPAIGQPCDPSAVVICDPTQAGAQCDPNTSTCQAVSTTDGGYNLSDDASCHLSGWLEKTNYWREQAKTSVTIVATASGFRRSNSFSAAV